MSGPQPLNRAIVDSQRANSAIEFAAWIQMIPDPNAIM
jgi:hypothetical protein